MSQYPPRDAMPLPYGPPPVPQSNAYAVTSLVCGIVGCLAITPFVAIVTGIVGLKRSPAQGGRGLAIAGIVLGSLWIVGALGIGGATYFGFRTAIAQSKTATMETLNALAAGDFQRATQHSTLSPADAQALAARVRPYGSCTGMSVSSFSGHKDLNAGTSVEISGEATFANAGVKRFTAKLMGMPKGMFVQQLSLE